MSMIPKHILVWATIEDELVRAFMELIAPENAHLPYYKAECWSRIQDRYLEEDNLPPLYFSDPLDEDWQVLARHYDELIDELTISQWSWEQLVMWAYSVVLSYNHEGRRLMRHKRMRELLSR